MVWLKKFLIQTVCPPLQQKQTHHHHHVQRCSPLDFSAHGCGGHKLRAQLPFVCLLLLRLMLPFLAPMWTNQASPRTACMFNVEQLHLSNFSFSQMCSLGGQPRERCTKLDFLAKFLCYGKMRMLMMSTMMMMMTGEERRGSPCMWSKL